MYSKIYNWIKTWRKTIWWVFLVVLFSSYVGINLNRILSQNVVPIDYLAVILLFLLLLLPLASEIDFLGFSIKKEIESIKTEITGQIITLRSEIHQTNIQNTITFPQIRPLSDDKLEQKENDYSKVLGLPLTYAIKPADEKSLETDPLDTLDIPKNVRNLGNVRLILENELRRIYKDRFGYQRRTPVLLIRRIIQSLEEEGLIEDSLVNCRVPEFLS